MNVLGKVIALGALGVMAACTNNDPSALGGGAGGNGSIVPGSPSDPRSPAYFQQTVGDRVLFAVDQSTLSPQAQTVLQGQADWLLANPDFVATIEGHADEQGTREYNLGLGAKRANAAREFLISRGVAGNRLTTVSYGKERPIEICSTEECYSKNRRAVTVLTGSTLG
ncbi:peptidoglycan-associated lipoprotein Pal [Ruegeria sp. R14_0]|uniref:peptidoglycan-associated lipoprotein Pal n=1 Tax=Ruegeria sp. R14_0 TaxID=2821100 RepID=UPI001ADA1EEB|nr:peptidoglycan-associated lipoprotein Pal [Ruegeria sp. R14_0]MBO9444330.1 peptidoglycan-associated lipoprotein Pal [Ruegeria sp. R14_0]